jgi:hypothetical protein
MGGGGGGSSSLGDTRFLEQKAKELLKQGASGPKNVFISFAYEDLNEVNLLRGQAKNDKLDLEFNDRSVQEPYDSDRAEYIRQKIRERINQCSTTVVYLSANTDASRWVRWEVEKSLELGKRVIAVHSGDAPPRDIPAYLSDAKVKTVPWSSLSSALDDAK